MAVIQRNGIGLALLELLKVDGTETRQEAWKNKMKKAWKTASLSQDDFHQIRPYI